MTQRLIYHKFPIYPFYIQYFVFFCSYILDFSYYFLCTLCYLLDQLYNFQSWLFFCQSLPDIPLFTFSRFVLVLIYIVISLTDFPYLTDHKLYRYIFHFPAVLKLTFPSTIHILLSLPIFSWRFLYFGNTHLTTNNHLFHCTIS